MGYIPIKWIEPYKELRTNQSVRVSKGRGEPLRVTSDGLTSDNSDCSGGKSVEGEKMEV